MEMFMVSLEVRGGGGFFLFQKSEYFIAGVVDL